MLGNTVNPTIYLDQFLPVNGDLVQQYSLIVPNIISNKVGASTTQFIRASGTASVVRFDLNEYSLGNDIVGSIYAGSVLWAAFDIPEGQTSLVFTPMQLAALAALNVGDLFRLDITQVGGTFPGSGLVATIVV